MIIKIRDSSRDMSLGELSLIIIMTIIFILIDTHTLNQSSIKEALSYGIHYSEICTNTYFNSSIILLEIATYRAISFQRFID